MKRSKNSYIYNGNRNEEIDKTRFKEENKRRNITIFSPIISYKF